MKQSQKLNCYNAAYITDTIKYEVYEKISTAVVIVEKSLAIISLSLPELISLFSHQTILSLAWIFSIALALRSASAKIKRRLAVPATLRRCTRSIKTPRRRMRIITIITANNNGLVGRSRSSCSDGRRSVEPRYEPPAHYLEGPWNERVPPHQRGLVEGPLCRSTRRRRSGSPVLASSVGCEPVSRPGWVVSRSHRDTRVRHPSCLVLNFGEDVPTTRFSKNRYTRDNFRRLNRRVSESLSRQETPSSSAFASSTFSLSFSNFFVSRSGRRREVGLSEEASLQYQHARARGWQRNVTVSSSFCFATVLLEIAP